MTHYFSSMDCQRYVAIIPFFTIYFLLSLFLSSGLSFLRSRVLRPCYDSNLSGQFCDQYKDVVRALRTGDIRLLRHALQTHEDQYVTVTCATTLQMFISSVGVNQSLQLQFQHGVFESLCQREELTHIVLRKGISDVVSYGDFVVTVSSRNDELESNSVNVNLKIFAVRSISCFGET